MPTQTSIDFTAALAVRGDFVLVPREPTEAMYAADFGDFNDDEIPF